MSLNNFDLVIFVTRCVLGRLLFAKLMQVNFSFNVIFDGEMNFPPFAEKMVGMILHKIFKRVKQFIENVRL